MPELPEVETTRRGVEPYVVGRRIVALAVHEPRLRWRVPEELPAQLAGQRVERAGRRAKYLLIELSGGTLLLHLGMSGSLRVLPAETPRVEHDHLDLVLDSGLALRFNDPRRFGSLHYTTGDPQAHPLLASLAPEPFDPAFDAEYLWKITRRRRVSIKQLIMNSRLLTLAIRVGGTTLRDYVGADGSPGYFRQRLYVYERTGKPCRNCRAPIRALVQGQRSTYYCPSCQR